MADEPWYESDESDSYFGQIMKNAVKKAGYVLEDITVSATYVTVWPILAAKYKLAGNDWSTSFKAASESAKDLVFKLYRLLEGDKFELDDDIGITVDDGDAAVHWYEDPNGLNLKYTQWFPTTQVVSIMARNGVQNPDTLFTFGFLRRTIEREPNGVGGESIYGRTYWAVNLNEVQITDIQLRSATNYPLHSLDWQTGVKAWRIELAPDEFYYGIRIAYLYDYGYTWFSSQGPMHFEYHDVIARSLKLLNRPSKNPEEISLMFGYVGAGEVKPYHPGEDISYIESVTGGNGSDASEASPTLQRIGHGGNGGHGGGGAGAAGFSKMEMVNAASQWSVDLGAGIGTMAAGTGGHGSVRTPGYHGGCIIFYNRGDENA